MNDQELQHCLGWMETGTVADWEMMAGTLRSFPDGADELNGERWVLHAIAIGAMACLRWMLARKVALDFWDSEGRNVLEACIEHKDVRIKHEMLGDLIRAGARLDVFGFNGWSPLHLAAARNDLVAARMLLEAGADPDL